LLRLKKERKRKTFLIALFQIILSEISAFGLISVLNTLVNEENWFLYITRKTPRENSLKKKYKNKTKLKKILFYYFHFKLFQHEKSF
jgi:hypothetical protein